ncbi:hypothetical protein GCM10010347_03160 [Streptomyces cirratus]|uniref:Uncharacterized protein n=1 Tax=Streptomyces cirratus TaxID=68187 RepID=A0ABQ3EJX4_9ACTN|nr:hypothetical protein GCM10010347_03160 [Streptomyces cirratus]
MAEKHADRAALVAERLCSKEDGHQGLLCKGGGYEGYVALCDFTVRDRGDTDQGRRAAPAAARG